MQVRAKAKNVRMSARKVGQIVELIRGRPVREAAAVLQHTPRAAARDVAKVLKSAVANAENNFELDPNTLYVASAVADQGSSLPKRWRAKARGQAGPIIRRTTHITVVVDDERPKKRKFKV